MISFGHRFNLITEVEAKGMNTFVGNFSLPALIFISLCQLDLSIVNYKFLLAILVIWIQRPSIRTVILRVVRSFIQIYSKK